MLHFYALWKRQKTHGYNKNVYRFALHMQQQILPQVKYLQL